uniref:Ephrin-A5a n=1 Tax=Eptatretus burgeri TaxID=7764 RepID=A0A8C4Q8G2_EPTBU
MKLILWAYHFPIADRFYHLLSDLASSVLSMVCPHPQGFCRAHMISLQTPSGESLKIQDHSSPPLICSSLFLPVESTSTFSSISFFPSRLQDSRSPPSEIITHPKPRSFLSSPSFLPLRRLQREDHVVEVQINDYLDIYCPGLTHHGRTEGHIIYMVNFDGYQSCDPSGRGFKRWNCTRPYAMHAPLKYSEKFQLFTPFSLGFEFQPGQEYYYISSSFVGGFKRCLKLRVAVCCPINESRVVTAQASRSRARRGPSASPTGFLLILALLPLLLTQAYVPLFT